MKNIIRKILKESGDEKFFQYISSKLKPPYLYNLEKMGINFEEEIKPVMTIIFNQPIGEITKPNDVRNIYGERLYYRDPVTGSFYLHIYNENGDIIYSEDSFYWNIYEYDENGKEINSKMGKIPQ